MSYARDSRPGAEQQPARRFRSAAAPGDLGYRHSDCANVRRYTTRRSICNLQSAICNRQGCTHHPRLPRPTIVRAPSAEAYLRGKRLDLNVCAEAGRLACSDEAPIDDVRGSAAYRLATLANLCRNGLQRIAEGREREGWPEKPVLLETLEEPRAKNQELGGSQPTLYGGSLLCRPGIETNLGHYHHHQRPAIRLKTRTPYHCSTLCARAPALLVRKRAALRANAAPARSG